MKHNRVILGIIVNGELYRGGAAASLAAYEINRISGKHVTYSKDIQNRLDKTGHATIHGCNVSYYYL